MEINIYTYVGELQKGCEFESSCELSIDGDKEHDPTATFRPRSETAETYSSSG